MSIEENLVRQKGRREAIKEVEKILADYGNRLSTHRDQVAAFPNTEAAIIVIGLTSAIEAVESIILQVRQLESDDFKTVSRPGSEDAAEGNDAAAAPLDSACEVSSEPVPGPSAASGGRAVLPDDSQIGALHVVRESWSGYLEYTTPRTLRYAGRGRWEIAPGSYTLWHQNGGSVYGWAPACHGTGAIAEPEKDYCEFGNGCVHADDLFKIIELIEGKKITLPTTYAGAKAIAKVREHLSDGMWFPDLLEALGWQGGTIHQCLAEVRRLRSEEEAREKLAEACRTAAAESSAIVAEMVARKEQGK